jgi:hypothetical protein
MRIRSVALLALAAPSVIEAQARDLRAGDRVRVWAPAIGVRSLAGTLENVSSDSLRLSDPARPARMIPVHAIDRIDLSIGNRTRKDRVRHGMLRGIALGSLAGIVVQSAADCVKNDLPRETRCDISFKDLRRMATIGASIGGGVGLIMGARRPRDDWKRLPLPLRLSDRAGDRWRYRVRAEASLR